MALNNKLKSLATRIDNRRAELEPESEEDLEKLESDVRKMVQKILEIRSTIPDQIKIILDSVLSSQRPNLPVIDDDGSEPGPFREHDADMGLDQEREMEKKVMLLGEKISSNISAMSIIVKKMKECIFRIEKLEYCKGFINPTFTKRRIS